MEKWRAGNSGIMYRKFRPGAETSGQNTGTSGGPKISGENSAQNLRDPSQEENPKGLSQNSTGKLPWPELPGHRKFSGGTSREKFRDPSREESQNDSADFPLGRNFRPEAGISAHQNFRPKGRNFRSSIDRKPLQSDPLLHLRSCLRSFHLLGLIS